MTPDLRNALAAGTERVTAWAGLLDRINVFPVPDGDTGRNLAVSLAPLRRADGSVDETVRQLLTAACGNSGNIAARFFSGFLPVLDEDMATAARQGRSAAWESVAAPKPGTMLTVFDGLADALEKKRTFESNGWEGIIDHLEGTVRSTTALLPALAEAGVVDAGALGMFIFLEGFFRRWTGTDDRLLSVSRRFTDSLAVATDFRRGEDPGRCIDTLVRLKEPDADVTARLSEYAESLVMAPQGDRVKLHFHIPAGREETARQAIAALGAVERWTEEDMERQTRRFFSRRERPFHLMTDAAGSVTRADAERYGFTLLDSQVLLENRSIPETALPPHTLYEAMGKGVRVATAQASDFERHECYRSVLDHYDPVLYLCVGSAYTGNFEVAAAWAAKNDPDGKMTVLDTGAASGRLGMIVLETARYAESVPDAESVSRFARVAIDRCEEYLFLDRLRYLAAGGRLPTSKAFFGDLLRKKPVISPQPDGVHKAGVVRDRTAQLAFALDRLEHAFNGKDSPRIMLEYTDNREWVETEAAGRVRDAVPGAEILLQPLSLTSGVHMGPGTWGIAFLPTSRGRTS